MYPAVQVRKVFARNFKRGSALMRKESEKYRYITIVIEYPGLLYKTVAARHRLMSSEERYATVKANVENLKVVQLGITLSNMDDDHNAIAWEFNFCGFHPMEDAQDPISVEFLKSKGYFLHNASVFVFRKTQLLWFLQLLWLNYKHGVRPDRFADMFWQSRLPLNYGKTWITFHGAYDMAFLMKIISGQPLPENFHQFQYDLTLKFGQNVFHVKHIIKSCNGLYGGLESVAKLLNLQRVEGLAHHAGSDSLLTWLYKKIMDKYLDNDVKFKHACIICGLHDF